MLCYMKFPADLNLCLDAHVQEVDLENGCNTLTRVQCMQAVVPTQGDPSCTIHLVSFKPYSTLHSSGFFGGKIEVMLRLAGLPYRAHNGNVLDKKTCPKSKVGSTSYPHIFPPLACNAQSVWQAQRTLETKFTEEAGRAVEFATSVRPSAVTDGNCNHFCTT
jgi:hypothetical protein